MFGVERTRRDFEPIISSGFEWAHSEHGLCAHKRVRAFVLPDGCCWAVPRQDLGAVRECVETRPDRFEQLVVITTGQIGSADRSREKSITADEQFRGRVVQTHTARRVPGHMNHSPRLPGEFNGLVVFQQAFSSRGGRGQARCFGQVQFRIKQPRLFITMHPDGERASTLKEVPHARDVIHMGVRQHDGLRHQPQPLHGLEHGLGLTTHIHAPAGMWVCRLGKVHQKAVGLPRWAENERMDTGKVRFHTGSLGTL